MGDEVTIQGRASASHRRPVLRRLCPEAGHTALPRCSTHRSTQELEGDPTSADSQVSTAQQDPQHQQGPVQAQ